MKAYSSQPSDSPKLLTRDIERLLGSLKYFPDDSPVLLRGCQEEANGFTERALKLYGRVHFSEEGVPEPPIISASSAGRESLYTVIRWCMTIWPAWKKVFESPEDARLESKPDQPANGQAQASKTTVEAGKNKVQFTDTEENILKALGDEHMTGPALLKKAGYDYSSHYRAILSQLVKRDILGNDHSGYFRK